MIWGVILMNNMFMDEAIMEAYEGIQNFHGGPFGAVVVKDGKIIGRGHNQVLKNNDPTAHGEIMAIRDACKNLNTFDLSGCSLYSTAQPCPMCLCSMLWANIEEVYYGCNTKDTENIGFRDDKFYEAMNSENALIKLKELSRDKCYGLFEHYASTCGNATY